MFRLIKIIFNAFLLVLAIIGFNAIGGQKYVEAVKVSIGNFIQEHALEEAKKMLDDVTNEALNKIEGYKEKGEFLKELALYIKNREK